MTLPRGQNVQASARPTTDITNRAASNSLQKAQDFSSNADNITSGTVNPDNLPIATTSSLGVVQPDGTTILVNPSGVITAATATSSSLGIVEPDNTTITISGGIISATGSGSSPTLALAYAFGGF